MGRYSRILSFQQKLFGNKIFGFCNKCQKFRVFDNYPCAIRHYSLSKQEKLDRKNWNAVIGLEVHAQITSNSKLFSHSGTQFLARPNTQVSFFDASLPGTLPVLNYRCVEAGVLTALALNCHINKVSTFDRKHYFYADLPCGYQITQQNQPIATDGKLDFVVFNPAASILPYKHKCRLKQIQLEQDSGKSLHLEEANCSLIDLNRAGLGLMELVFEPDLKDGEQAAALIKELHLIFRKLGTCSCQMEEGALRVDANISVNRPGEPWGIRTEVKNLNSIRVVAKAIDYEIERQIELLDNGMEVVNETRAYDVENKQTVPLRDKEAFQDYRFMPEPNLPPLHLCEDGDDASLFHSPHIINIDHLKKQIPLLPEAERNYLMDKYKISLEHAVILVNEEALLPYYIDVVDNKRDPVQVFNFLINHVYCQLKCHKLTIGKIPVDSYKMGQIIDLWQNKTISLASAQDVLNLLFTGDKRSPLEIISKNNWMQINDEQELERICQQIIDASPEKMKKYKKGKTKIFQQLMNDVCTVTENRANMGLASKIMSQLLQQNIVNK